MGEMDSKTLVLGHIRRTVEAAKRKGVPIRTSAFVSRLRKRNPGIVIEGAWGIEELLRAAVDQGVPVELDGQPPVTYPPTPRLTSGAAQPAIRRSSTRASHRRP